MRYKNSEKIHHITILLKEFLDKEKLALMAGAEPGYKATSLKYCLKKLLPFITTMITACNNMKISKY